MPRLKIEVDPAEAGFDAQRLAVLDRYFDSYVADGRLPGWSVVISRRGRVLHHRTSGLADMAANRPLTGDTVFRLASLTKQFTTVAALSLYEEGAFDLHEPVSRYLPAFADARVYRDGPVSTPNTDPLAEPVLLWHLLTHTSGLTYGFWQAHPVETIYGQNGYGWDVPPGTDLRAACDGWSSMPLLFQPGTGWNYGVSTDVLGAVLEVVTGKPIHEVLAERVLRPLGTQDTGFWVAEGDADRVATLYGPDPQGQGVVPNPVLNTPPEVAPAFLSPGGGLLSSVPDYHRLVRMLVGGGELDGVRLLSPRTVRWMTTNQLPGGADLHQLGRRVLFGQPTYRGLGFGFNVQTVVDATATRLLISPDEFSWYSGYSTLFLADPVEELVVVFFASFTPVRTYPLYSRVRQLVYQAMVA